MRKFDRRLAPILGVVLAMLLPPATTGAGGTLHAAAASSATPGEAHHVDLRIRWDDAGAASAGARVSRPIPLEPDTVIVGADWGGDEDAVVEVRSRADGSWGEWTRVLHDDHEGPDPSSTERSTDWSQPVIVAGADAVQFRTETPGLKAKGVVVNEQTGGVTAASTTTITAAAGAAGNSMPTIMTRKQWGANESLRDSRVPSYASTVRFGVVHHTASSNSYSADKSASIVKGIYEYHTKTLGWWDIGYNFIVDKYGQVFEGRYGGMDRAVIGAHAAGFNSGSTGIAVLGNYVETPLPPVAQSSLEQLLAWKFTVHHANPKATTKEVAGSSKSGHWNAGDTVVIPRIVGHKDVGQTACPGSIIDLIHSGSVANNVASRMGPQIYTDAPDRLNGPVIGPPTEAPATTVSRANWRLDVKDSSGKTIKTSRWNDTKSITAAWNHQDGNGNWVREGSYDLVLSATLADGRKLPAITLPLRLKSELAPWIPLTGDWNGDGKAQPGWWNLGKWILDDGRGGRTTFQYGRSYDAPVVGDWDGNGKDEIGIIRDREWHLRRTASGGPGEIVFTYGRMTRGDLPLVGDWNGDGKDEIGIIRDGEWHLRNSLSGGAADRTFIYGRVTRGDIPITGDWDRRGGDTIGIVRNDEWHLRNQLAGGTADISFRYGRVTSGDIPIVGDWDGNGTDTVGIVRGDEWHLRNYHSGGPATTIWTFAGP